MNWYLGSYERELEKRKKEMLIRYAQQKNEEDSDIMEVDSNGNCLSDRFSAQSSCDHLIAKTNRIQELQDQTNALVLETQKFQRQANCKRHAVMLMTGMMRAMDPIFTLEFTNLEDKRTKLRPLRERITDEVVSRQLLRECNGMEGELFLQKGSMAE